MIPIALVFVLVAYFEWKNLKQKNRSRKMHRIVLVLALCFLLFSEALFMLQNTWSIAGFINSMFEPLQRLLVIN